MKGLILNNLYSLRSYWKSVLLMSALFAVIWGLNGDYSFIPPFLCVVIATSAVNTFSYDEYYHWDSFPITMPVTRKQMVLSKYITFLLLELAGAVIGIFICSGISLIHHNFDLLEILGIFFGSMMAAAYLILCEIPLCYKFGTQKMKIWFIAIIGVAAAIGAALLGFTKNFPKEQLFSILKLLGILLPFLIILFAVGSITLSIRIFEKKEF